MALWGGRFSGKQLDDSMRDFNSSIRLDQRLALADVRGSQVYATALFEAEILAFNEHERMQTALETISNEWQQGLFEIKPDDEDVHTANERRLGELVGKTIAGKLHTGRSRNDQVAVDMKLWLRNELQSVIVPLLRQAIDTISNRALAEIHVLMPGYTHLQRAQPTRWSHFLLSYGWALKSDLERINSLLLQSKSRTGLLACPLGSGAMAGNPFRLDRDYLAKELKFSFPTPNSMHATGDRDFILDCLYCCAMTMTHLSRLAEDLIIYSSAEFGYVKLSDQFSTGSSLMPQKKNPDSLELIRGKTGRVVGNLMSLIITCKALPSTYNKDLQEDKQTMFESLDTTAACLTIAAKVIDSLTIDAAQMQSNLSQDMLATDLAEYLVRKGVPFREAHHAAGSVVRLAESRGCLMSELSLQDFRSISTSFDADVRKADWWDYQRSVESRSVTGGTAEAAVRKQIKLLME